MSRITRLALRELLRAIHECPQSFYESDVDRIIELAVDPHVDGEIDDGATMAINDYQAKCINSYRVPFIDVDSTSRKTIDALQQHLGSCGLGGHLYGTHKGYRIALSQEIKPSVLFSRYLPMSEEWLRQYGIDYSYALFCLYMGTYRARCTAKPWRISGGDRHASLSRYERDRYPVARYMGSFGSIDSTPHSDRVMVAHDRVSRVTTADITLY